MSDLQYSDLYSIFRGMFLRTYGVMVRCDDLLLSNIPRGKNSQECFNEENMMRMKVFFLETFQ